jgi:hypothetical protein
MLPRGIVADRLSAKQYLAANPCGGCRVALLPYTDPCRWLGDVCANEGCFTTQNGADSTRLTVDAEPWCGVQAPRPLVPPYDVGVVPGVMRPMSLRLPRARFGPDHPRQLDEEPA